MNPESKEAGQTDVDSLYICGECDLLMKRPMLSVGYKSVCPRCGHTLFHKKKETVRRTFAAAFSGLCLFIPASFMPILHLKIVESNSFHTLISGVAALWNSDMFFLAATVFAFTLAAPFIRLLLLLYISGSLYLNIHSPLLKEAFKGYLSLSEWSMLEVYLAGVVVSSVKLVDIATVNIGGGLYYLTALLIVIVGCDSVLDRDRFWRLIDEGYH